MADTLLDDVGDLLREAADQAVLPLFRKLDDADVSEKAHGEVVTVADQRAEELLSAGLRRLRPGSMVVGEEGVADDPRSCATWATVGTSGWSTRSTAPPTSPLVAGRSP